MKTLLIGCAVACVAGAQGRSNWNNSGGDAQHTGWERADTRISKDTVKDLQLLWKMKLENRAQGPASAAASGADGATDLLPRIQGIGVCGIQLRHCVRDRRGFGQAFLAETPGGGGDADSAWGMFAANRDPKETIAQIGMGGQLLPQSLYFAKGRFFVEIVETDGDAAGNQTVALRAFAAALVPRLKGRRRRRRRSDGSRPSIRLRYAWFRRACSACACSSAGLWPGTSRGRPSFYVEDSPDSAIETMKKLREHFGGAVAAPDRR